MNPTLDAVIAAAWPARVEEQVDGWTLRLTDGVTRRANSALATAGPTDLAAAVRAAEQFYDRAGRPTTFLVSEASTPELVRQHLLSIGYASTAPTWVLAAAAPSAESGSNRWETSATGAVEDEWFGAYWSVEPRPGPTAAATIREVLLAAEHPMAFVVARAPGGVIAAVGQVVVVDGWGCIQCLATLPHARRQGAGRAVVESLIGEAVHLGAEGAVAAVMADNPASLGLFEQLGFECSHRYSYYVAS